MRVFIIEKKTFTNIGSYWKRNNQNEIDIVVIGDINKKTTYNDLIIKAQNLVKEYKNYEKNILFWWTKVRENKSRK